MIIAAILVLGIIIVLGLIFKLLKDKKYDNPILGVMAAGVVCSFSCLGIVLGDDSGVISIFYAVYYIAYSWLIFAVSTYIFFQFGNRKVKFFSNPIFYLSIIEMSIMLKQIVQHNIFKISFGDFFGYKFWGVFQYSTQFMVYKFAICISWFMTVLIALYSINKIPTVYKAKVYIVLFTHALYFATDIISLMITCPVLIQTILIYPASVFVVHFGIYHDSYKLKNWALSMFAQELSDCLILYDAQGTCIHVNQGFKNLISVKQLEEFEKIEKFEAFIADRVSIDSIDVKKIQVRENEYKYFAVKEHRFQEKGLEIGAIFTLTDLTGSIEKILKLEKEKAGLAQDSKMKSDYLTNMSHEIRTPMNVVIGMAEMALRESLPVTAQEYIEHIKNSGSNLLNIINDILDYSKIEAGKLSVLTDIYEPLLEIRDTANAIAIKLEDKDIELLFEVNPKLPRKLEGDMMRIRQVLHNVVENAIKFTEYGQVRVRVDYYNRNEDDEIVLCMRVADTGIGIHEKDIGKLFESFKQLDTKKNRAVEGTGLGLAISKDMLEAMGGNISVTSEFGIGSEFYFEVPQRVVDKTPVIEVSEPEKIHVYGLFGNDYLEDCVRTSVLKMKLGYTALENTNDLSCIFEDYETDERRIASERILVIEERLYNSKARELLLENSNFRVIVITDRLSTFTSDMDDLKVLRKPFNSLTFGLIIAGQDNILERTVKEKAFSTDFVAVDAQVLIVDDNSINITVAEGLLQLMGMKIYTALSGEQAIEMVRERNFDIIFMDHMMPGMDGVEATEFIRKNIKTAENTPIIALTANAVAGAREMFIKAGMNDFIPKPIEMNVIADAVRRWLPPEKISEKKAADTAGRRMEVEIPGLDTKAAIGRIGSADLYMKITADYYKKINSLISEIQELYDTENWTDYTIKIHALKSSSRQIGADELADIAQALEKAGNEGDIDFIKENADDAIRLYKNVQQILSNVFDGGEKNEDELEMVDVNVLKRELDRLRDACEELDMDIMESVESELKKYTYPEDKKTHIQELYLAIESMDIDECGRIIDILELDM